MFKTISSIFALTILMFTTTQPATADFLIANGSATTDAWVTYSTYRNASAGWPAGFRTTGWYKVERGSFRNLSVPNDNTWVYIRVERPYKTEIKPPDHVTRDPYSIWIHPSKRFTVVETAEGDVLKSNHDKSHLKQVECFRFRNGGRYTITETSQCDEAQTLPIEELYAQAMQSVVWIENDYEQSQGSGVLIDAERKLVVTNEHVVGNADFVFVSFPVRDENGELIYGRNDYSTNYLSRALKGESAWGRVIAKDAENDVAILQLDYIQENSRAIDHDFTTDLSRNMRTHEIVHILGNPGALELWRWTLGLFKSDDGDWVHINADVYGGNSGGPVLNGQGKLVGIAALSNKRTSTWAVPVRDVKVLLDTVKPRHTFRIENPENFTIEYQIKWDATSDWKVHSLGQESYLFHWWNGATVHQDYPQIRFDSDVGPQITRRLYRLGTFLRHFGNSYEDHVTPYDAYQYYFTYDDSTQTLDLYRKRTDCVPLDVNEDGVTDLKDLEFVASRLGLSTAKADGADVDGDGDVDVSDIVFAAALLCDAAAAPSPSHELTSTLTAEDLRLWISEAKQFDVSNPDFQRGINVLERLLAALTQVEAIPEETVLLSNYPNPFNPETWVPYQLSKPAEVTLTIYALNGRLVRWLPLGHQEAGVYQSRTRAAYWDGKNDFGEQAASGVYFYRLRAGDYSATRKMLIRK